VVAIILIAPLVVTVIVLSYNLLLAGVKELRDTFTAEHDIAELPLPEDVGADSIEVVEYISQLKREQKKLEEREAEV